MSELIRKCDLTHQPNYTIIHKGGKLFDDLAILVCSSCVDKPPFNKLPREPIINNE